MADVVVRITGDTKKFLQSIGEAGTSVEGFGDLASKTTKVVAAGFALLSGAVAYGVSQFKEQEQAINSLNQALANQNIYTKELTNSYQEMAKEIQKTTVYSDDQVIKAEAIIQSHIGQLQISKELIKATVDLAAAKGMDLASAAELVGRTIGTETNALQRQGVSINAAADASTKLSTVTRALTQQYGGQAEALAKGTGILSQTKNSMDDLFKLIGEKAMPSLQILFSGFKKMFDTLANSKDFQKFLQEAFSSMRNTFEQMSALMQTFADNFGVIANAIGMLWRAVWDEHTAIDSFKRAWTAIKEAHQQAYDEYKTIRDEQLDEDATARSQSSNENVKNNTAALTKDQQQRQAMEDDFNKREFEKKKASNQKYYDDEKKFGTAFAALNKAMHSEIFQGTKQAFADMADFQQSSNQTLKNIGKVAAIANIVIKTAESAMSIYAGFATIPIIGPVLGVAGAAAAIAFGAEQVGKVNSAAQGGLLTGGIPGVDSIPLLAMPGELVVPTKNFDEVVDSVAARRSGQSFAGSDGLNGTARVLIGFDGPEASRVLTVRQNEDRALGISQASS